MQIQVRPCRVCGGVLDTVLDLGNLAISTFPRPTDPSPPSTRAPLDLCQCRDCALVQLRHTVAPDLMFKQYWYQSGINETMHAELQSIVAQAVARVPISAGDYVLDIGANDGTLLEAYLPASVFPCRIAIEPADNFQQALAPHCDWRIHDYFPTRLLTPYGDQIKIITQIACFYDLDDPGMAVAEVARLLAPDGVWIVQFQDLHQMIHATAFDNICHEHLVYYSLGSFERLIAPYGLRVVDAERRAINGGSLRLTIMHNLARLRGGSVAAIRQAEEGCEHWQTLERFAWHVGEATRQIRGAVETAHAQGQIIDLYGASTKGNTLLQYCTLGPDQLRQAWERSLEKIGRQTITGIPIVIEAVGRADPPDLLLAGIWQFRDAIIRRERSYLAGGGMLLFPLPKVDLVGESR